MSATPGAPVQLRRPLESEARAIIGWARTAEETARWCGSTEHPVLPASMLTWWAQDDVEPWALVTEADVVIGYGELWLDADENEVELARLIVAPDVRGRGVGQRLVRLLTVKAAETGLEATFLRVVPENEIAIRCYTASGFTPLGSDEAAEWNEGQPREYVWMLAAPQASAS